MPQLRKRDLRSWECWDNQLSVSGEDVATHPHSPVSLDHS